LYKSNFFDKDKILIPDLFAMVLSSDTTKFEIVTAVEAKKLVLEREDNLIGHKRLIYVINKADKTRELTRKVTTDFFKNSLGFTEDEIIFADVTEFESDEVDCLMSKFSDETKESMEIFARKIFEDTKHGLAK
jgi:hypothetical protein